MAGRATAPGHILTDLTESMGPSVQRDAFHLAGLCHILEVDVPLDELAEILGHGEQDLLQQVLNVALLQSGSGRAPSFLLFLLPLF